MIRETVLFLAILFVSVAGTAKSKIDKDRKKANAIVAEGKMLYRSEKASWLGTDIFMEAFKEKKDNIGGYFSYSENSNLSKCIFYSKEERPRVIATISFDSTYNVRKADVDGLERAFTDYERELYDMRIKAQGLISKDTNFTRYSETNFNLVPFIYKGEKKVYILTGSQREDIVILGNDYLLLFDKNSDIKSWKRLHHNIIFAQPATGKNKEEKTTGSIHTHLPETGDYITVTDVCTLMLYEHFSNWKQHVIVSAHYISIWNCSTDTLIMLERKKWARVLSNDKDGEEKK